MTGLVLPGAIPSPTVGALHVGPLAIRGYAMCILAGIVVAVWVTGRRLEHRGIPSTAALDVATWAVPFGIVGARIYHVITSPQAYFGANGHPLDALKIWEGGLGVWGAIALGAVGAAIGARRSGGFVRNRADRGPDRLVGIRQAGEAERVEHRRPSPLLCQCRYCASTHLTSCFL